MKSTHILKVTVIAATLAVFSQAATAQKHDHKGAQAPATGKEHNMMQSGMRGRMMQGGMKGMMQGGMMGRDCPMMGGSGQTHAAGRIAFLKAELEITDSQKPVFDAYTAVLKDNLQNMHAMRQSMMGAMSAKTAVERLDAHLSMMEGRTASLQKVKPKLEALYAALNDEQKKKANAMLTRMGCMM